MKIKNPYLKILEYSTWPLKRSIYNTEMSKFWKVMLIYALSTWYGILLNKFLHQWGVAWRWSACGTAEVLWKPRFALIEALSSSVWLSLVSLIFLLTTQHRFSVGFRSGQFAGQLRPVIPWSLHQLLVVLALWAGAKCFWLKEIIISIKHTEAQNASVKSLGRWLCWFWTW